MGGKTGEWGEGPAGATVPYDVRGLHAARVQFAAPRRYSLKTQKSRAAEPSALGSGQRRTIIVTEPPDMLADVPADFGGCPRRSR